MLNAVPTAEGAVQIAMQELPITISQSRCLIIGNGRIGKALHTRLRGAQCRSLCGGAQTAGPGLDCGFGRTSGAAGRPGKRARQL